MKTKVLKKIIVTAAFAWAIPSLALAQWSTSNLSSFGLPNPSNGIYGIISNILMWLLGIFGFLGVIGFVISGIMYFTAAGSGQVDTAKKAMLYSIIGVIVGLIGVVVITAVNSMLGATSTQF
jgi:hypothetical protein